MSEILKCSQCGNKLRQFPGARFTICSYCGYQTNFEQPKPAPVYNDFSNHSTETVYNYQSPEPARISRIDTRTGHVTYRDEEFDTSKFIGLALLTLFTVGFALPILQTFFVAKSLKNGLPESSQSFRSTRDCGNLDNVLCVHIPARRLRTLGIVALRSMDNRFPGLESEEVSRP